MYMILQFSICAYVASFHICVYVASTISIHVGVGRFTDRSAHPCVSVLDHAVLSGKKSLEEVLDATTSSVSHVSKSRQSVMFGLVWVGLEGSKSPTVSQSISMCHIVTMTKDLNIHTLELPNFLLTDGVSKDSVRLL